MLLAMDLVQVSIQCRNELAKSTRFLNRRQNSAIPLPSIGTERSSKSSRCRVCFLPNKKCLQFCLSRFCKILHTHVPFSHNSSCFFSSLSLGPKPSAQTPPVKSGISIIFTTSVVQPVKCCVLCPAPVSGLYCSHAKPVSCHES